MLGARKDKSFYLFENQLVRVNDNTPISEFEIKCLKEAHTDMLRWKDVCNVIKMSRGNKYPKDWLNVLRREKLMTDSSKTEKNTILNIINGLIKPMGNALTDENVPSTSFGVNTSSPLSTIIIVDSDSSIKKNLSATEKSDKIFFESKILDTGDTNKNVDFISRFDTKYLIEKSLSIFKDSEFEFEHPFKNCKIRNGSMIKNTKELYDFIVSKVKMNQTLMENETTMDDIGIDYIKKVENKKYKVYFLY